MVDVKACGAKEVTSQRGVRTPAIAAEATETETRCQIPVRQQRGVHSNPAGPDLPGAKSQSAGSLLGVAVSQSKVEDGVLRATHFHKSAGEAVTTIDHDSKLLEGKVQPLGTHTISPHSSERRARGYLSLVLELTRTAGFNPALLYWPGRYSPVPEKIPQNMNTALNPAMTAALPLLAEDLATVQETIYQARNPPPFGELAAAPGVCPPPPESVPSPPPRLASLSNFGFKWGSQFLSRPCLGVAHEQEEELAGEGVGVPGWWGRGEAITPPATSAMQMPTTLGRPPHLSIRIPAGTENDPPGPPQASLSEPPNWSAPFSTPPLPTPQKWDLLSWEEETCRHPETSSSSCPFSPLVLLPPHLHLPFLKLDLSPSAFPPPPLLSPLGGTRSARQTATAAALLEPLSDLFPQLATWTKLPPLGGDVVVPVPSMPPPLAAPVTSHHVTGQSNSRPSTPAPSTAQQKRSRSPESGEEEGDHVRAIKQAVSPPQRHERGVARQAGHERLASMTFEELRPFFELPINDAARALGAGLTMLKKKCRDFNVMRWPHRKIKSVKHIMQHIKELSGGSPERLEQVLGVLEKQRADMATRPELNILDETNRLRQACFKASYKKRKLAESHHQ